MIVFFPAFKEVLDSIAQHLGRGRAYDVRVAPQVNIDVLIDQFERYLRAYNPRISFQEERVIRIEPRRST